MGGTRKGGLKAAAQNKEKNPNFYRDIGRMGGKKPRDTPRGFANMDPEKRKAAGAKGGTASRRREQSYYDNRKIEEAMAEMDEWLKTNGIVTPSTLSKAWREKQEAGRA